VAASASSFVVPSAVFSGLSALSGPVAVVGSRKLPVLALHSLARFGRWLGRLKRPLKGGRKKTLHYSCVTGGLICGKCHLKKSP